MALVLNDRVKETTTSTGTGTINLAGAETGFETFVAGIGNSNTTYYAIVHTSANEFEVGLGTVTDASPDTLSRTTIISSTNSDSAVDFSAGTKNVFCTLPASKAVIEDASGNIKVTKIGFGISPIVPCEILSTGATSTALRVLKSGSDDSTQNNLFSVTEISGHGRLSIHDTSQNEDIRFDSNGDSYFNGGNLGVGTTSPAQLFEVNGNGTKSRFTRTGSAGVVMEFVSGSTASGLVNVDGNGNLGFGGGSREKDLTITSSGKVGIGTGDPGADGYSYAEDFVVKAGVSADDGVGITLQSNTRRYGVLAFGDSADTNAGELWYDHTLNSLNMRTSGVSRFLLDSSGNATFTGNVTAYGSVSDERLKENIKVIENPIEKIKDLKGVTFTYKKDGEKSTGLIAQDLEKVLPEAVYTSETIADERGGEESEEHLAIRYGNTVGLLVEAIKEQQKEIETLNDYVKLQSASIMDMERRLNELEND